MARFKSWESYNQFANSVRRMARYVFEEHVDEFLRTVIETSATRTMSLPSNRYLWRAQVDDHCEEFEVNGELDINHGPPPPARMKPLPHAPNEGRVNPKGIPCLYTATEKETAMAEVRPWIGSFVSVGQFRTLKDLALINCASKNGAFPIDHLYYIKEPDPEEREKAVWAYINHAFSKPVSADPLSMEYIPTQILAELFRKNGFDGIMYKSLLGTRIQCCDIRYQCSRPG